MLQNKPDKTLESHKIFPLVAWVLVILFAFFVYHLAQRLEVASYELESGPRSLEHTIGSDLREVDFGS
jgi:hypothetical protein